VETIISMIKIIVFQYVMIDRIGKIINNKREKQRKK